MIRAYIREQWGFGAGSIAIDIVREIPNEDGGRPHRWIMKLDADGTVEGWCEINYTEPLKPTLVLGPDESSALCIALNNHYQGVDDQRALRKDYDAERARVDKMLDALIARSDRRPAPSASASDRIPRGA